MKSFHTSRALLEESKQYLAGGVDSTVQSAFAPHPLFFDRGLGSHFWDVDGNEFIDYVLGFGPLILGHCPRPVIEAVQAQLELGSTFGAPYQKQIELSKLIAEILPAAEVVRYNNSGTEAVQGALRLARAYTGKDKIVKFEGHYHGWLDNVYISNTLGTEAVLGPANSPNPVLGTGGQVSSVVQDVIVLPWNDLDIVDRTLSSRKNEIAAVITEPIMANCGVIMPKPGYLEGLRRITQENGILLIFDEVITGFRASLGGAQAYYGVIPDIVTFAKAVGGGYPISGFGARRELMDLVANGTVGHGGTLNANGIVVSAAVATLKELARDNGAVYDRMRTCGQQLMKGIAEIASSEGIPMVIQGPGTFFAAVFCDKPVTDFRCTSAINGQRAVRFAEELMKRGIYIFPKGRGLWYLSAAHTEDDIDSTLVVIEEVMPLMKQH
jgi:glutamate-1-semialdehyde 2,1-aminomutase